MKNCVYAQIAKRSLMKWNGLNEQEAQKMIEQMSFEELEKQVGAKTSVNAAVFHSARFLRLTQEEQDFFHATVFGEETKQNVSLKHLQYIASRWEATELALYALAGIHNVWVIGNKHKFADENRQHKKYQHLPLEMIGWQETTLDLAFLQPVLELLKVEVNEQKLERAYTKQVQKFFRQNRFLDENKKIMPVKVAYAINRGQSFYPSLSPENTARSIEEAIEMANQCIAKVSNCFEKTANR